MAKRDRSTDAERERRRAEQQQLVTASLEQLRSSKGWRSWLGARKTFHGYSVGNVLLIVSQHPTATRVAGFRAWLALGYCVRRGERAIRIWAPCKPSRKQLQAWEDAGSEPEQRPRTFWKLTAVFAQDQVDPLPPPAVPASLEPPICEVHGRSHSYLFAPLTELAQQVGYTMTVEPVDRAAGYCDRARRRIVIAERLDDNGRVATAVHELAHALISSEDVTLSYAEEELVVESIAFCVANTVGLDTTTNSIPYIAAWATQASTEVLEQTAQLIDKLARRIEDHLDQPEPQPAEKPGTAVGVQV